VVVSRSGGALVSINEVNRRRARLVLGWVTVSGLNSRCGTSQYVTSHPGQLSLAIPLWVGAMRTSQRAVTPCDWGVQTNYGPCVHGWQVKLCDLLVTLGLCLNSVIAVQRDSLLCGWAVCLNWNKGRLLLLLLFYTPGSI